jgi:hypothetical protein
MVLIFLKTCFKIAFNKIYKARLLVQMTKVVKYHRKTIKKDNLSFHKSQKK